MLARFFFNFYFGKQHVVQEWFSTVLFYHEDRELSKKSNYDADH